MPSVLLSLRTDLKSLKYGHDRRGGGDSSQPYITTSIPLGSLSASTSDDGFIRGGIILADKSSLIDAQRINSFLNDKPKGRLFLERQVGLQLSNPKIETRKFAPGQGTVFSALLGIGSQAVNRINDFLPGPTRIYTSLNTIAQIQQNAFGIHYERHGLLPIQDENTKYYNVVVNNNINGFNRLLGLKEKLIQDPIISNPKDYGSFNVVNAVNNVLAIVGAFTNKPIKPLFTDVNLKPQELIIDQYGGGPGSSYGRGVTLIKRYDVTSNGSNKVDFATKEERESGKINYYGTLNISLPGRSGSYGIEPSKNGGIGPEEANKYRKGAVDQTVIRYTSNNPSSVINGIGSPTSRTYDELKDQIAKNNKTTGSIFNYNNNKNTNNNFYNGDIKAYTTENIEYKNGLRDKNNRPVIVNLGINWRNGNREERIGSGRQDLINLSSIFSANPGSIGDVNIPGTNVRTINDLVKFRIQALNSNNPTGSADWMVFRAYLTQFSDNTNAAWSDVKYVGRGESFYIYTGFSRKIQIGFKVAALSTEEMQPIYQKLNYLMGNLMPDYTEQGLMRGPLVKMTVGNWIDGQDGIINDLTYTIPQDSPWEIGLPVNGVNETLILPHIVEVSMTFTPIGSQTRDKNEISRKSQEVSHIAQNYNREKTQYIKKPTTNTPRITTSTAATNPNINSFEQNFGPIGG